MLLHFTLRNANPVKYANKCAITNCEKTMKNLKYNQCKRLSQYCHMNVVEARQSKLLRYQTKWHKPNIYSLYKLNFYIPLCRTFCISNQHQSVNKEDPKFKSKRSTLYYISAIGILFVGLAYAAVPLYRAFCQAYSLGGTVQEGDSNVENMIPVKDRMIKISFNADTASSMMWNFKPQQNNIVVAPGETALAFYTAVNPTDKPVIGISTYNVVPFEAGQYFNKIQCFCFEEQMLNPKEEVSMPVFFYIDPEFTHDPKMENVDLITLSYTFFEAKEGFKLPLPGFPTHKT